MVSQIRGVTGANARHPWLSEVRCRPVSCLSIWWVLEVDFGEAGKYCEMPPHREV